MDGTICIDGHPVPGAAEAVRLLEQDFIVLFVSNTTSRLFSALIKEISSMGLRIEDRYLWTPQRAADKLLPARGHDRGILMVPDAIRSDFSWFTEDPEGNTLLIADEGYGMTLEDLHAPFRLLMREMTFFYTLQKNRYFRMNGELRLDMGPLVAALEYACGRDAVTLGKPSHELFTAIAECEGVDLSKIIMVGDDIEFDVLLQMKLGITGILVKTGKYLSSVADQATARHGSRPDFIIESIVDLPGILL
ncbi:MAG: HAD hydrolase-like protein [Candidatus Wallbacteria bacterium]|nr:HAD hydrolase-like protein [Candidatus Wallbacteria bacterium]